MTDFVPLSEAQLRVHNALYAKEHPALLASMGLGALSGAQESALHLCEFWLRRLAYCGGAPLARASATGAWAPVATEAYCDFTDKYAQVARKHHLKRYADHLQGKGEADSESLHELRMAYEAFGDDPSGLNTRSDVGFGATVLNEAIEVLAMLARVTTSGATDLPNKAVAALRQWKRGRGAKTERRAKPGRPKASLDALGERTVETLVRAEDSELGQDDLIQLMTRRRDFEHRKDRLWLERPGRKAQSPRIRSWAKSLPEYRCLAQARLDERKK